MNNVTLIGRLTRDPDMRVLESGRAVTRFTVAVDRKLSRKKRDELRAANKQTADFISIVVWGKQAETCGKFLAKGRLVSIEGRVETGSFEDKEGVKRFTTDILANRVGFLEWPSEDKEKDVVETIGFEPVDDDIPF